MKNQIQNQLNKKIADIGKHNPVISIQYFSQYMGFEILVVAGWINCGYIQTVKIGKSRLINIASMTRDYTL